MEAQGSNSRMTINLLLAAVIIGTPVLLCIDSHWLSQFFAHGQQVANGIMAAFYATFLVISKPKLRWLIVLMTVIGFFGEILGSIILTLYRYRLGNIPLYVPIGHAVVFATVYHFTTSPTIWRHRTWLQPAIHLFAGLVCLRSLLLFHDTNGFIWYLTFLFFIRGKKKPLFYLNMFVMVYYLEITGTYFQCWAWYNMVGNHPDYFQVANPPAGIAGLYMVFDMLSNYFYLLAKKYWHRKKTLTSATYDDETNRFGATLPSGKM